MPLLTGPPGSGKTHAILEEIREALRRRDSDFRLLVPTATMAAHLRNELAREGFVFRPVIVSTLSRFIDTWAADLPLCPASLLQSLVKRVLRRSVPREFRSVIEFPGFHACVAGLVVEMSTAGYDSKRLAGAMQQDFREAPLARPFLAVLEEVEREVQQRGLGLRGKRLFRAAEKIEQQGVPGIHRVFVDGFFLLAEPELSVIGALRRHADVTVTLPEWTGAEASRAALLEVGLAEKRCERIRPHAEAVLLALPTIEQEVEEISRRIVEITSAGTPFREIGILVRNRDPYVPVLRATLERFGIPARFYFAGPVADHAAIRYFAGAVDAMLGGWDFEQTLGVLRSTASGFRDSAEMDQFDFRVRNSLPGQGIEGLLQLAAGKPPHETLVELSQLSQWRGRRLPARDWAERLNTLAVLYRPYSPTEGATHEQAALWRSHPAALQAFRRAVRETELALDEPGEVPFKEFWEETKSVLRLTTLRVEDRRRNVVHVFDAYESRQWELPIVFVCGLLEKLFPAYHAQDPILPDEARERLARSGLQLRTARERDQEEEFLYAIATSRATRSLVLSYPRFNPKGDANLPSFYLARPGADAERSEGAGAAPRWRPETGSATRIVRAPVIYEENLRESIRQRFRKLSSTSIESFLQCPFQFFGRYTLRLDVLPAEPEERLDTKLQGEIVHAVLAEFVERGGRIEERFDPVFAEFCRTANVPQGYRTEAVRLELLRNLERLGPDIRLPDVRKSETERRFEVDLADDLSITGRFDRIDFLDNGRPLVIDYKYSRSAKLRKLVKGHEEGVRVQGSIYLLAAERKFGCKPVGFLFAGLRGEVSWEGRHLPVSSLDRYGEACTSEELGRMMDAAKEISLTTAAKIREGRIVPEPADPDLCLHCDFADICRFETAVKAAAAGEVDE